MRTGQDTEVGSGVISTTALGVITGIVVLVATLYIVCPRAIEATRQVASLSCRVQ